MWEPSLGRQVETVDGIKKEQCAHPFVKVVVLAAELIQSCTLVQEFIGSGCLAEFLQGAVADFRVAGEDGLKKRGHVQGIYKNRVSGWRTARRVVPTLDGNRPCGCGCFAETTGRKFPPILCIF